MFITEPKAGDPISAEMFVRLIREVQRLGKWHAAAPLTLVDSSAGFSISTTARDSRAESVGIHQSQVHTMRTDSQDGWQLNSFAPGDSDLLP